MTTQKNRIKIYGNLGGDPELKTITLKATTYEKYDPVIDGVVEVNVPEKQKELRTFSLAVSYKNDAGDQDTRWVRCTDWNGVSKLLRKGDRVAVLGYFREHVYEKDGERIEAKDFQVESVEVEKRKVRTQAD